MKLSELKGKSVISVSEARKLGVVDDVLVDPSYRQVAGLRIKAEGRGPDHVVSGDAVRGIGPDAVTIVSQDVLQSIDRARDLASLPSLNSVLHSRVVTEGGQILGTINEVDLDVVSREIRGFEYTHGAIGGLFGRQRILQPQDVVGVGPGLVTVRESAPTPQE